MIDFERYRFVIIAAILLFMWLGLMVFFYLKADEVTKNPCSICAKKMGESVYCTKGGLTPITRVYYPNYTIDYGTRGNLQYP